MSKHSSTILNEDGLILSGYQKKLKTMKKKFFVLHKETLCNVSRLEYYDNEKKFKSGLPPKRVIKLKHCFNINRRLDTKYDYVIALSTKDGGFGIVLETEDEMLKWLTELVALQRFDASISDPHRPQFEHVWQVSVQRKGLADEKGIVGHYHVCLTTKSVTFIRIGPEKSTSGDFRISNIEFFLTTIRRCGDSQCFFYMEVGRQSIIGPGELWMETDDTLIAQNMHYMISSAMSAKGEVNMEPMRKRSSSATEASKPINVLQRRQTQPDNKSNSSPQTNLNFGRERCDSLPSRNRTSSECSNPSFTGSSSLTIRNTGASGLRAHQRHSNSPPMNCIVGCSESEESSISIDELDDNGSFLPYRFNSRSSEGVIIEENTDELVGSDSKISVVLDQCDIDTNCQSLKLADNNEENYLSMAPVKCFKDVGENMINSYKHINSLDDLSGALAANSLRSGSPRSEMKFPEYASDNAAKSFTYEVDSPSERPTRAYSIGSKVEHNRTNKRIGIVNEAEQNATRVRAFSVGSRAKIPRCDLQRGFLLPKLMIEQNSNSNNNISSITDVTALNQLLNMNSYRDKKSTSAPMLIHKSHNSVDRMGDLMEIDFSKAAHNKNNTNTNINNTTYRMHHHANVSKALFSKSVPSSTNRDMVPLKKVFPALPMVAANREKDATSTSGIIMNAKSAAQTDNGYLEMKPVGDSFGSCQAPRSIDAASVKYKVLSSTFKISDAPETRMQSLVSATDSGVVAVRSANISDLSNNKWSSMNIGAKIGGQCSVVQLKQGNEPTEPIAIPQSRLDQQQQTNIPATPNRCTSLLDEYTIFHLDSKSETRHQSMNAYANSSTNPVSISFNLMSKYPLHTDNPTWDPRATDNSDDYININATIEPEVGSCAVPANDIGKNVTSSKMNHEFRKDHHDAPNGKLAHAVSDEDHRYEMATNASSPRQVQCKESGYKIRQMKSDSSLQTQKTMGRPAAVRKERSQCSEAARQQSRPKSSNSLVLMPTTLPPASTLCDYMTSSSISCLSPIAAETISLSAAPAREQVQQQNTLSVLLSSNEVLLNNTPTLTLASTPTVTTPTLASISIPTPTTTTTTLTATITNDANTYSYPKTHQVNVTSRPPSVTSEHELYYASLDLPQCSTEVITTKVNKAETAVGDCLPVSYPALSCPANNAYAKIDFDHSDSSSSSSKVFNL